MNGPLGVTPWRGLLAIAKILFLPCVPSIAARPRKSIPENPGRTLARPNVGSVSAMRGLRPGPIEH